jgi:acyl-coenzyme A synthetase/AMP-(fatty) acid ligase
VHAILAARRYPDARERFRWDALWDLFDGDRERLNLAHECVDRHAGDATALRIALADGRRAEHTFRELTEWSSRVARFLERHGIGRGDRVGLMLEPSLPLYAALFGTLKRGAVAVPLFTLFGPEGEVGVVDERGQPVPPGVMGEIAVRRKVAWFLVKDRGFVDEDGYVHHGGRSDDVIISAGWTMSAVEIEDVLMAHPDVREAAVVDVADALRRQVAKAFVVAGRRGDAFEHELQD